MDLHPKKSLGQHFLIQRSAIRSIVETALASPASRLLEIGPGPGVLTEGLLADGRPLWAVDLDPDACVLLRERFGTLAHFHLVEVAVIPHRVFEDLIASSAAARFILSGVMPLGRRPGEIISSRSE